MTYTPMTAAGEAAAIIRGEAYELQCEAPKWDRIGEPAVADNHEAVALELLDAADWLTKRAIEEDTTIVQSAIPLHHPGDGDIPT